MTDLITIDSDNFDAMASVMGMQISNKENKNTLSRIRVVKKAIKGETSLNGRKTTIDVVPSGWYSIEDADKKYIYAETISIRPFLQRFMYQKYDSNISNYVKTIMSDNINVDLKDNMGTFNCGKPSGYIEDFNSLPEGTKEIIRQVKRTRVLFGEATLSKAITEKGDSASVKSVPFIWEIDTKEGYKNLGMLFNELSKMRRLPMQHTVTIHTDEREGSTSSYFVPNYILDKKSNIAITDDDQNTFREFMSYIDRHNTWVSTEWDKNNKEETSPGIANEFIDIDATQ
jgi:hypothetical protein